MDAAYSYGFITEVFDYQSDRMYWRGIELNQELIGSVCIVGMNDSDQKAVLGYCMNRNFGSNGYATEAVKAVLQYMFVKVGLNRIEASH